MGLWCSLKEMVGVTEPSQGLAPGGPGLSDSFAVPSSALQWWVAFTHSARCADLVPVAAGGVEREPASSHGQPRASRGRATRRKADVRASSDLSLCVVVCENCSF